MRRLFLLLLLAPLAARAQAPVKPNYDVPFHGHGRTAPSPDGRVYYETEGSGPVLVLVAGGPGGGHASFHPWFSRLSHTRTVVYMDNIGRARSDRLADTARYTVPRDAEDIEAVRQALGVERISLIGHSYGGFPAMAYALKYPEHTDRLVLSDTLYNAASFQQNIDSANWNVEHQFPDVWARLMEMRRKGVRSSAEEYGDLYGEAEGDMYWYDPDKAGLLFRSGDGADGFNYDVYLAMIGLDPEWKVGGTMKGYNPVKDIRKMRVPTLICVGRFDRVATPKVAAEMKALIPSARMETFERSGHRPWVEETDRYFDVVRAFLEGREAPATQQGDRS